MKWILLLFLLPFVQGILITEVMYDPLGADNNKEFVEILGTNLSGYIISDSASKDTLIALREVDSPYSLIVEEGFDFAALNCSIYSIGSAIGNGLSENDLLTFDFENTTIDTFQIHAVPEGASLDREGKTVIGGSLCAPTPDIPLFCEPNFGVSTDKRLYGPKENVELGFVGDIPPDTVIEYGIRDSTGKIVKERRTTHNDEPKNWQIPEEGIFEFFAILDAPCMKDTLESSTLFAVKQEKKEEKLEIISVDVKGTIAQVNVRMQGKDDVVLKVKRDKKNYQSYTYKLDGSFTGTLIADLPCGFDGEILLEGSKDTARKSIALPNCPTPLKKEVRPNIDSLYLRQKTIEDEVTLHMHTTLTAPTQATVCTLATTSLRNETETFSLDIPITQNTTFFLLLHNATGPLAMASMQVNVSSREVQPKDNTSVPVDITQVYLPSTPKQTSPTWIIGILAIGVVLIAGIVTRLSGHTHKLHKREETQQPDDPAYLSASSRSE